MGGREHVCRWASAVTALLVLGALALVGGTSAAATAMSSSADSTCVGTDAWSATWVVGIVDGPGDGRWRLDGAGDTFVPVGQTMTVERVVPLDVEVQALELRATVEAPDGASRTVLGGSAVVQRPDACTSAPAPPQPPVAPAGETDEPAPAVRDVPVESSSVVDAVTDPPAASPPALRSAPPPRSNGPPPAATEEAMVASMAPPQRAVDRLAAAHSSFVQVSHSIVELARDWFVSP